MKILYRSALLVPVLALAACSSEPEETPDISEAIPIDGVSSDTSGAQETGGTAEQTLDGPANETENASADTPSLPDSNARSTSQRELPATMESGSNSGNEAIDLEQSKLQRAD